ncbi:MAG: sulfatase-like hydrolase/transferase, partial [Deltaproteobacteria bacterium]|nr:sulfatase-like hydrolase/transferase [Deltaproteobacteria bacterium]
VLAVCALGAAAATHAFRAVYEYGFLYPALLFLLAFWTVGLAFLALHAWFPPRPSGRGAGLAMVGSTVALASVGHLAAERIELVRVRMLVEHHRRALGRLLAPGVTARREGAKVAGKLFPRAISTRTVPGSVAAGAPPFRSEPHVVVLALDALRRDAVGALGGAEGVTPALDALAARAQVWERAYAPGPGTGLSVGSLLTGLPPATLMATGALPLTLPAALRERGYVTSSSSAPIHLQLGTYPALRERDAAAIGFTEVHSPGGATVADQDESRIAGLSARLLGAEAPRFEYVHLMGSHGPYPRAELPSAYHSAVRRADALLGRLVSTIDATAARRPTLLCVLGDHGEGLGEHGFYAHNQALYAEQTAVPLVCAVPGAPPARHADPLSLFELPRLLFAALGSRWPGPTLGAPSSFAGGLALSEHFIQDRLVWRALWTRSASLHDRLLEGRREVFDLERDPGELADLAFGAAAAADLVTLAAEVEALERALAREVDALAK